MTRFLEASVDRCDAQFPTESRSADGNWLTVSPAPLSVASAAAWVSEPACGAIVLFCGTVRDHSVGRPGVVTLEYEAYLEQVIPRLDQVAASARRRWPNIGRIALAHRIGLLAVGETPVVVAVSTTHRDEAFKSARYCIDTLKATVPIWKRETWANGTEWSTCSHSIDSDSVDEPDTSDSARLSSTHVAETGL
jgi:molybdopterin synthase catalytic subunit